MGYRSKGTTKRIQRSETVGVRLDPKLRYLAELAAREQQRTLSSFIEWAIRRALTPAAMYQDDPSEQPKFLFTAPPPLWGEGLWDVDPSTRFVLLASGRYDLMTVNEQRLWKTITAESGLMSKKGVLDRKKLKEMWDEILISGQPNE